MQTTKGQEWELEYGSGVKSQAEVMRPFETQAVVLRRGKASVLEAAMERSGALGPVRISLLGLLLPPHRRQTYSAVIEVEMRRMIRTPMERATWLNSPVVLMRLRLLQASGCCGSF
jgi:hypothetical protein